MDGLFKKAGGLGGGAQPPPICKHVMIRATFLYCTHGDDMMFVFFIASMDGLYKSGGVGGGAAPLICKHKDPGNLPQQRTWR